MCFHIALATTPKILGERYQKKTDQIQHQPPLYHVSAFTHDLYPIITAGPEIQYSLWGLIPHWIQTSEQAASIRNQTLNARSETVFTKPSFRTAVRQHRCLIPVTGFFDWRHEGEHKIPYFISLNNEEIFSLAGIYDVWLDPATDQQLSTFSILTTEANPLMATIHNTNFRMPVILPTVQENEWIDPNTTTSEILRLLTPYDSDQMKAYPIRNDFLKKQPTDPSILLPAL